MRFSLAYRIPLTATTMNSTHTLLERQWGSLWRLGSNNVSMPCTAPWLTRRGCLGPWRAWRACWTPPAPPTSAPTPPVTSRPSGDLDTETRLREGDERVDTRSFDFPRVGLLHRAPNSCTTGVGGPPVNCPESISVGQYGTGFNAASGGSASNGFFEFSVNKP